MIDFQVAYDKLAGFETSEEIAEYLTSEGIKAFRAKSDSCAISAYIRNLTGKYISTTPKSVYLNVPIHVKEDGEIFANYQGAEVEIFNTDAMIDFIEKFDEGEYPELVHPNDDYKRQSPWCDCSDCI